MASSQFMTTKKLIIVFIYHLCIYIQNQRGKGIGTELIRYIGGYAYSKYQKMSICILKGNDGAKKLYERLGLNILKILKTISTILEQLLSQRNLYGKILIAFNSR